MFLLRARSDTDGTCPERQFSRGGTGSSGSGFAPVATIINMIYKEQSHDKNAYHEGTEKLPSSLEFAGCILSWYSDDGIRADRMGLSSGRYCLNRNQTFIKQGTPLAEGVPRNKRNRNESGHLKSIHMAGRTPITELSLDSPEGITVPSMKTIAV